MSKFFIDKIKRNSFIFNLHNKPLAIGRIRYRVLEKQKCGMLMPYFEKNNFKYFNVK